MRRAAGIVGILVGINSLLIIGLYGGFIGSATSWLGSGPWSHGDSSVNNLGQMISLLSYLSGLLALVGGIVAFSNTRLGGIILAGSAFSHWYLLGFGFIGKVFVLPVAAAAAFAFFAAKSGLQVAPTSATTAALPQTSETNSNPGTSSPSFDRAKWNALIQYDKDISELAQRLKPLGQKWIDEAASSFLALNDKAYLPEIEKKIVAAAKTEDESRQQQLERAAEQRRLQQEHFQQEQERRAESRRIWRDRIWGNRAARVRTIVGSSVIVLVAILVVLALKPKKYDDPISYCAAFRTIDVPGSQYIGPDVPNWMLSKLNIPLDRKNPGNGSTLSATWRCFDGKVLACILIEGSERVCGKVNTTGAPTNEMVAWCQSHPAYDFIPYHVYGANLYRWMCNNGRPIQYTQVLNISDVDQSGYSSDVWQPVQP